MYESCRITAVPKGQPLYGLENINTMGWGDDFLLKNKDLRLMRDSDKRGVARRNDTHTLTSALYIAHTYTHIHMLTNPQIYTHTPYTCLPTHRFTLLHP